VKTFKFDIVRESVRGVSIPDVIVLTVRYSSGKSDDFRLTKRQAAKLIKAFKGALIKLGLPDLDSLDRDASNPSFVKQHPEYQAVADYMFKPLPNRSAKSNNSNPGSDVAGIVVTQSNADRQVILIDTIQSSVSFFLPSLLSCVFLDQLESAEKSAR
jgi:hypothetical protein